MEKPLYPSPYMRITQGYGEGSHRDSYAIDEAGSDGGIDFLTAPFTGTIRKIYTKDANEVWLESNSEVEYPDGTIDYMTILFAHDNNVENLYVGKVIQKGERFYEEGTKGISSGNHCHIECGKGRFSGSGWIQNSAGYWSILNRKKPQECLWIDSSIKVLNNYGYSFKKIEENSLPDDKTPPIPDIKPTPEIPGDKKEQDKDNKSLIFTCHKDDIYAIRLKKGQKLYLESSDNNI